MRRGTLSSFVPRSLMIGLLGLALPAQAATGAGPQQRTGKNRTVKSRTKAPAHRLLVQAVPMPNHDGTVYLPPYFVQVKKKFAVSAKAVKIQGRIGLQLAKPLEYMPGGSTYSPEGQLQLSGFKLSGERRAPYGMQVVEGKPEAAYEVAPRGAKGRPQIDYVHHTSRERDLVFAIIERGLKVGDVKIVLNAADLAASQQPSVLPESAFLQFGGKKRGLTEWSPAPVRVSDIVASFRKLGATPSTFRQLFGPKHSRVSEQAIFNQVVKQLGIDGVGAGSDAMALR